MVTNFPANAIIGQPHIRPTLNPAMVIGAYHPMILKPEFIFMSEMAFKVVKALPLGLARKKVEDKIRVFTSH